MKTFTLSLLLFIPSLLFSQSKELYSLFRHHEYEKCLKKCNQAIDKDDENLDAYWIKALVYFEMAQNPKRWAEVTDKPVQESLKSLARIKVKDDGGYYFKERQDTILLIRELAEEQATEYKESGRQNSAVRMYKLMFRAFEGQEDALQLAQIYIMADDLMECIIQVDRIYSSAPADVVPSKTDDARALNEGVAFLVKNFMFKDAFKMIEKYRAKFASNPYIISSFKKAVYLAVDTLYTNKDKMLFFEYAQRGKFFYGDDPKYIAHLEELCIDMIKEHEEKYLSKPDEERTWRDTAFLRKAFQYADMGKLLLPESKRLADKETVMIKKYHMQIPDSKVELFKKYAAEALNAYRKEGCYCDSAGQIPPLDPMRWNDILGYLAQTHAKDMFAYNYTSSTNRRGLDLKGRVDETDLKGIKLQTMSGVSFMGALKVGENIGYGVTFKNVVKDEDYKKAIEAMMEKWILAQTGGNCERIMDFEFTEFGLGVFGDKWVLTFAYILEISD